MDANKDLTDLQIKALKMVSDGLTDKQIGKQWGISPETSKGHVLAACRKLGAVNRANAVALAFRKKILK